jgi:PAS domain S-box-containing protein
MMAAEALPKILVVDDRAENLLVLEAQLRGQPARFVKASSGEEALNLLLLHDVALALVDVQMPGMDGFELAELMRGATRTRQIPIIFVTAALHDQSRIFKGYDAGAVDFLVKPIDDRVLGSKVSVFLQLHRQKEELAERLHQLESAHAALRETAELSRRQLEEIHSIYDSAHIGLCVFDRDLRYVRINRRLADINGRPAADHIGKTVDEVLPSMAATAHEIAAGIFRTGIGVTEIEFTGVTPSQPGIRRTWLEQWLPLKNSDGVVTGINVVAEEVTERRRTEEALRTSEERFRTVIENSRDGINMLDLKTGRYVFMSPAQVELTGFSADELRDMSFEEAFERVHPYDREISARQQREIAAGRDMPAPVEYRWKVKSGEYRWFADSRKLVRDAEGNPLALVGVSRDITDRKTAEAALRASEARLSLLSRTASRLLRAEFPQQIIDDLCHEVMQHLSCDLFLNFLVDPECHKLKLNASGGLPAEEVKRLEWLDFGVAICGCVARDGTRIVAEDVQCSSDPRADLVRSYGIEAYCCHALLGEGRKVLGTLSFGTKKQTQFSKDEIALMRAVSDQVATAIQRMEARHALSVTNAQLIEEGRRKNEFIAMLSHELRNPLAPIKNSLYILDHAEPHSQQARRAKATIDRQVNQLARLVDDLLDVTRIARNKIQLQRDRIELTELVQRTVEDHRSEFEKAGVRLDTIVESMPLWVSADGNRIGQAVGNLLQNAAKFTPRNGSVAVTVGKDESAGQAVIRVHDSGVGIKPEMLPQLFQPFMQAEMTLDRSQGGLGLGLALVKGLVELHGGTVGAFSAGLDQGTEFTIRLPTEEGPLETEHAAASTAALVRQRVLIIEDNEDAAESLREVLEFDNHDVAVAHTGPTGIRKAIELQPTVILCDIGLPGMDGYEVARAIRAEPSLKNVPMIALSGYALPEDLRRAQQAGFDRHMAKPPSLAQINQLLVGLSRGDGMQE